MRRRSWGARWPRSSAAGVFADDPPDRVFRQGILADGVALVDWPEERARLDLPDCHPFIQKLFGPGGDGDGADAFSLAFQIGDDPAAGALLDISYLEADEFGAAEGAAEEQAEDGAVADGFRSRCRRGRAAGRGLGLVPTNSLPSPPDAWLP